MIVSVRDQSVVFVFTFSKIRCASHFDCAYLRPALHELLLDTSLHLAELEVEWKYFIALHESVGLV